MKRLLLLAATLLAAPPAAPPDDSIQAIRYATIKDFPTEALVMGAPKDERTDIAMVLWLIRGGGRNVLFDSGYYRDSWLKEFPAADYLRPDEAPRDLILGRRARGEDALPPALRRELQVLCLL